MTKICKLRIAGGNGNPANEGRECDCTSPRECPIGRGERPPGPEQDNWRREMVYAKAEVKEARLKNEASRRAAKAPCVWEDD